MAFLSIPIFHPLPDALSRPAILHDMSEDTYEQCTPVIVLSPTRKESGKKSVRQRTRRRRRASERYEHAEEQMKGRRNDFHLQIARPRWSDFDTGSSDASSSDENHWIQVRKRAHVKFQLSRRKRRNYNKPCGNLEGSPIANGIELVNLKSKGKQKQERVECESCSLSNHKGKDKQCQECGFPLPRGSLQMKKSSRNPEASQDGSHHRDLQLLHRLKQNEIGVKPFLATGSSTEMLAATEGDKDVDGAGFQLTSSFQTAPATYNEGSDDLKLCRSVTVEKDLMPSKYIASCCE